MKDDTKKFDMEVVNVVEHGDGSATFEFHIDEETNYLCCSEGLKLILYSGMFNIPLDEIYSLIVERAKYLSQEPSDAE